MPVNHLRVLHYCMKENTLITLTISASAENLALNAINEKRSTALSKMKNPACYIIIT